MFALIMDVALIPLYVYIALATNTNRHLPLVEKNASGIVLEGDWRWTSFFTQDSTYLLLMCFFIGAIAAGGLHLISAGLDVYLALVFRKINNLPPDMNPLEDNLTSRRVTKHKHKNSELTLNSNASTAQLSEAEKRRLKHLSGSTLSVGNGSRISLAEKQSMLNEKRELPFGHSRNGSKQSLAYSPHNPDLSLIHI